MVCFGDKGSGLPAAKKAQYLRYCVKAVDQTSPEIKGANDFEPMARMYFVLYTDQQHEGDTNIMKMKALLDDEARFQQLSARSKGLARASMGYALIGLTNSTFSVCPSFDQLQTGSKLYIQYAMGAHPKTAKTKQGFQGRDTICERGYLCTQI